MVLGDYRAGGSCHALAGPFSPALAVRRSWQEVQGQWPAMIVIAFARLLPRRYVAAPQVQFGSSVEIDVGTLDEEKRDEIRWSEAKGNAGGVARANESS